MYITDATTVGWNAKNDLGKLGMWPHEIIPWGKAMVGHVAKPIWKTPSFPTWFTPQFGQ